MKCFSANTKKQEFMWRSIKNNKTHKYELYTGRMVTFSSFKSYIEHVWAIKLSLSNHLFNRANFLQYSEFCSGNHLTHLKIPTVVLKLPSHHSKENYNNIIDALYTCCPYFSTLKLFSTPIFSIYDDHLNRSKSNVKRLEKNYLQVSYTVLKLEMSCMEIWNWPKAV